MSEKPSIKEHEVGLSSRLDLSAVILLNPREETLDNLNGTGGKECTVQFN